MSKLLFEKLTKQYKIKITPLREEIILILSQASQPLGAYSILEALRKKRPSAEPPTVYRVLEFLEKSHIIHRLAHNNTFLICKTENHHGLTSIVFTCQNCKQSAEFFDKKIVHYLEQISKNKDLIMDNAVIEITGQCKQCKHNL